MIYDKNEDTPQWKMAIVQGRADDGDNDNNVLVDYVRDPYKQSGVAVSLRLDNFGDDANDNKTWFRIDYHKANRMRNNAAAGEARDDFAKRCKRTHWPESDDGHCLFRAIVRQEQGNLKKPLHGAERAASAGLLRGLRERVAASLESDSLAIARVTTNLSYGEPLDQLQGRSRTKELAKRSAVSATEKELKVHMRTCTARSTLRAQRLRSDRRHDPRERLPPWLSRWLRRVARHQPH